LSYNPAMARYTLRVLERFEAAHNLRSYRGEPEPVHGHSWRVEAVLEAEELDSEGMAFDFVEVKSTLGELAGRFHHRHVNEVPPFDEETPTTENMARWFCDELRRRLPDAGVAAVTLWEGPHCSATYRP